MNVDSYAFSVCRRAWHQAHVPSATMRLVSHYLPIQTSIDLHESANQALRGTSEYYLQCIGGPTGLAQLYLEAGLLHLEGAALSLLSTSYSSLSSIRMPALSQPAESTEAYRRDREAASKYFERARVLQPSLDIPSLDSDGSEDLEMPSIELTTSSDPESAYSGESCHCRDPEPQPVRRRRKKEEMALFDSQEAKIEELDNSWYLYIPGLVGAGTALLVVGVVGALSLSTWRRNQGN